MGTIMNSTCVRYLPYNNEPGYLFIHHFSDMCEVWPYKGYRSLKTDIHIPTNLNDGPSCYVSLHVFLGFF